MSNIKETPIILKMQWEDFNNFILSIEADYPKTFKLTPNQAKLWWDALKEFDIEDLKKKYENHKKSTWAYTEPKLPYLIQSLKKVDDKQLVGKSFVFCSHCGKRFEYPVEEREFEECMERCLRIKYLNKNAKKFNINLVAIFKTDRLEELSLTEIDQHYPKFIAEIYKFKDKLSPQEVDAVKNLMKLDPNAYSHQQSLELGGNYDRRNNY